jgi:hypothetical protein
MIMCWLAPKSRWGKSEKDLMAKSTVFSQSSPYRLNLPAAVSRFEDLLEGADVSPLDVLEAHRACGAATSRRYGNDGSWRWMKMGDRSEEEHRMLRSAADTDVDDWRRE